MYSIHRGGQNSQNHKKRIKIYHYRHSFGIPPYQVLPRVPHHIYNNNKYNNIIILLFKFENVHIFEFGSYYNITYYMYT
jgi:hypothetical protein